MWDWCPRADLHFKKRNKGRKHIREILRQRSHNPRMRGPQPPFLRTHTAVLHRSAMYCITVVHYNTTLQHLHYTTVHCSTLHCNTLQHTGTLQYYTALQCITSRLYITILHYSICTTLQYTAAHCTAILCNTPAHCCTLHYPTLNHTIPAFLFRTK